MTNTNRMFTELQAAVQVEMQLDPGLISVDERKSFLNDALYHIGTVAGLEKEISLSVVDGVAELPDDFVDIIAVLTADRCVLFPQAVASVRKGYILHGTYIEIVPHTTESITLWYIYRPQKMTTDYDKPDIPNGYDIALIEYAVAVANRKNGNMSVYREYMAAYETKRFEMSAELLRRSNARVMTIKNSEYPPQRFSSESDII